MPLIGEMKFVERLQFFNGQRLAADDLQGLEQINREMRWLHNQSLHQPGVGNGYAVSGGKGDREVTIQPGYAIDSLGREIVLTEAQVQQVPPVADDGFGNPVAYDLTVSYPDDEQLEETETRDGVCLKRGVVRRREAPILCWVRLGPDPERVPVDAILIRQLQDDLRIRLARVEVLNCRLYQPVSVIQRRNARPAQQPYVACGRSDAETWRVTHAESRFGIELQLKVDTTPANFRSTPCYFANLAGDRVFRFGSSRTGRRLALDGFTAILDPKPQGFTFSLLIPALLLRNSRVGAKKAANEVRAAIADPKRNSWFVEWMGVER